eukprot:7850512-Pyramimonas_sp.AAC.1
MGRRAAFMVAERTLTSQLRRPSTLTLSAPLAAWPAWASSSDTFLGRKTWRATIAESNNVWPLITHSRQSQRMVTPKGMERHAV